MVETSERLFLMRLSQCNVRSSRPEVFWKTSQKSQENTCAGVSFEYETTKTPARVFSCEFCKIFKNTYLQNILERLLLKRVHY